MEEGEDGLVEFDEFSFTLIQDFGCCGDLRVTSEITLLVVGLATLFVVGLVGWPSGSVSEDATCEADAVGNTVVVVLAVSLLLLVLFAFLTIVLAIDIAIFCSLLLVLATRSLESWMAAAALVSVALGACGCGQDELGVADVDVEELLAIETASVAL